MTAALSPVQPRTGALNDMSDAEIQHVYEKGLEIGSLVDLSLDRQTWRRVRVIDTGDSDDPNAIRVAFGNGRTLWLPGVLVDRLLDEPVPEQSL